jgi:hypothetical protein
LRFFYLLLRRRKCKGKLTNCQICSEHETSFMNILIRPSLPPLLFFETSKSALFVYSMFFIILFFSDKLTNFLFLFDLNRLELNDWTKDTSQTKGNKKIEINLTFACRNELLLRWSKGVSWISNRYGSCLYNNNKYLLKLSFH